MANRKMPKPPRVRYRNLYYDEIAEHSYFGAGWHMTRLQADLAALCCAPGHERRIALVKATLK